MLINLWPISIICEMLPYIHFFHIFLLMTCFVILRVSRLHSNRTTEKHERNRLEVVMSQLRYYPGTFLQGIMKQWNSQNTQYSSQDLNRLHNHIRTHARTCKSSVTTSSTCLVYHFLKAVEVTLSNNIKEQKSLILFELQQPVNH